MADSRINLLTSAPSTANDDFFVVDGGTNGTRKLNAFSPTIGGNLAVTGTLTVGSTGTVSGNLLVNSSTAQVIIGQASASQLTYLIRPAQAGGAIQIVQDAMTVNRWLSLGGCDNTGVFVEGLRVGPNIQIPGTTASTSTSSGALVVSGGVGVAGAIYAGGSLNVASSSTALTSLNSSTSGATGYNQASFTLDSGGTPKTAVLGVQDTGAFFGSNTNHNVTIRTNLTDRITVSNAGVVSISSTTASTSTSSGALVVSGGVGVGNEVSVYGRIRAQLGLHADGNVPAGLASAYQVDVQAGTSRDILSFGDSSRAGLIRGEQDGSGRATLKFGRYTASTFAEYLRITGVAATDAVLSVYGTTSSTSTSSGALVVSGGVGVAKNASIGVNNSTGVLRICDNSFGGDYAVLTTAGTDGTGTYGLFISQSSGSGLNAPTGQMASLRVNNAAIVSANSAGPILQLTGTAPTLTGNSSLTFEFTSNTSLTLKMRGNDGVTRSASITFS